MKAEPVGQAHQEDPAAARHKLALFGCPVRHSLSPLIHADFARQHGLRVEYRLIESTHETLAEDIRRFFSSGGYGANITVPFKAAAATLVNALEGAATRARVVNVLKRSPEGGLTGHNTDGPGLVRDLSRRCGQEIRRRRILVIGAGGAARGIVPSLLEETPARVTVVNRSASPLELLSSVFPAIDTACLDALPRLGPYDVVINATSLGHRNRSVSIHPALFHAHSLAYDLSYGEASKPFLAACQAAGAKRLADGLGMLVEQAALAFSLWFGLDVETERIYRRLRRS